MERGDRRRNHARVISFEQCKGCEHGNIVTLGFNAWGEPVYRVLCHRLDCDNFITSFFVEVPIQDISSCIVEQLNKPPDEH